MIRLIKENFEKSKIPFSLKFVNGIVHEVDYMDVDITKEYSLNDFLNMIYNKQTDRDSPIYCQVLSVMEKKKLNAFVELYPILVIHK